MQEDKLTQQIQKRMEEISLILMNHEGKNFCLAKVHPLSWRYISYKNNGMEQNFVVIPSPAFDRLILQREYLNIVDKHPNLFGTGDDWDIIRAIKEYDKEKLLRDYSDQEFFDYIRGETMAYVFKVEDDGTLSDRILRLDLCRIATIYFKEEFFMCLSTSRLTALILFQATTKNLGLRHFQKSTGTQS